MSTCTASVCVWECGGAGMKSVVAPPAHSTNTLFVVFCVFVLSFSRTTAVCHQQFQGMSKSPLPRPVAILRVSFSCGL